jgi:hypothetical protein
MLIENKKFYYHPFTRTDLDPVISDIRKNDTIKTKTNLKFKFKIDLTEKEVVDYYYNKCNIHYSYYNYNRDIGSIKYLIQRINLDQLLYGIDVLSSVSEEATIQPSLLDITKYINLVEDKMNDV